jgi:16S rRNA processing protein RimM
LAAPRFILIARVAGAFGVRGEIRISAFSGEPLALLGYRTLCDADGKAVLTLTGGRAAKDALIARAAEVPTREAAEALKGLELYIGRDALPEPDEDEFYVADLVGLQVRDQAGAVIGRIKSMENFGAGDLLEIAPINGSPTSWLAFTRDNVPELHISDGYVVIHPPEDEAAP